jgi:low temperature requirement protein LtrA
MSQTGATGGSQEPTASRVSWLELFFDLVVVAAIAQLALRLQGAPTLRETAVFVLLYLAVWIAWISFTLYANIAGAGTRRQSMLFAMVGIAVMAAAIPQATGDRAVIFVGAYVAVRIFALRTLARTRRMLLAWPSVQGGAGIIPWVASLWVPPPVRYWLWALGLAIDVLMPLLVARGPRLSDRLRRRLERDRGRRERPAGHAASPPEPMQEAAPDLAHLSERLGLFVIIVLGEAVLQVVTSAAEVPWNRPFVVVGVGSLALLIGLWWPIFFRHGFITTQGRFLPLHTLLPLHFVITASITTVAVGLGGLVADAGGHVEVGLRWLLCGGVAGYYVAATVGGAFAGVPRRWLLGWGVPAVVVPLLVGVFGGPLTDQLLVWPLVAVAAWQGAYRGRLRGPAPPEPAQTA